MIDQTIPDIQTQTILISLIIVSSFRIRIQEIKLMITGYIHGFLRMDGKQRFLLSIPVRFRSSGLRPVLDILCRYARYVGDYRKEHHSTPSRQRIMRQPAEKKEQCGKSQYRYDRYQIDTRLGKSIFTNPINHTYPA